MNAVERDVSTIETTSSLPEDASATSLERPETYPVERAEPRPKRQTSLIRTLTVATLLPFAKLDEELIRSRGLSGAIAQSPYLVLVEGEFDEGTFIPVLAFSLGASHIVIPRRVNLNGAALRALAIGRLIMTPIELEFEE